MSTLRDAIDRVLRDILNALPAYFSIIGADGRYRMVCQSCEQLFGRPRELIEGQFVRDMFGDDAYAQAGPVFEKAFGGEPAHGEIHAVAADGKIHHLRVHLQPIPREQPGGQPAQGIDEVFAFAYDVTELRQAETDLRKSEERHKFLVEHNPDLITIVNRDNKIVFINHTEPDPATRREELIGVDVIALSPPDYRDWLRAQYDRVWSRDERLDIEVPILWRGEIRWFSSRLVALPHEHGPPKEMLIVSREITHRVAVEKQLRESEARFRQFAEALEDVVWIHNCDPDQVLFVNESFERIWGVPRTTLYEDSRTWVNAVHEEDRERVKATFQNAATNLGASFDVEYRIVRPDGSVRHIHDYGVAIRDDAGKPVRITGIARDITARKLAEDEKVAFQKQLLETQKLESLGVLAGGIAHDFNNLLTGIVNNVNLAQRELVRGPVLTRHLEQIESISLRASDLCRQMLAYAGKGRFVVAALDVNLLINEIAHLLNISVSKKVTLQFSQGADLPAIKGDASQIRQVLLNLVINANEAIGERVGVIRIATGLAELSAEDLTSYHFAAEMQPGPYVFLEVSDNGPGMAPGVLARIFEPFFTTKFTGRGLGLAAVQGIMRGHGGAVRVVSKPGKGTAFTLILPPVSERPEPLAEESPDAPALRMRGEVLIVDDETIISQSLAMMLETFGFTVHTAANGRDAIHVFARHKSTVRLVLLDLTMPILSGEETFHELRRIDPTVPIIFMSGYAEHDLVDRYGHSISGFLQKPFRMETLEAMISRTLS